MKTLNIVAGFGIFIAIVIVVGVIAIVSLRNTITQQEATIAQDTALIANQSATIAFQEVTIAQEKSIVVNLTAINANQSATIAFQEQKMKDMREGYAITSRIGPICADSINAINKGNTWELLALYGKLTILGNDIEAFLREHNLKYVDQLFE